MASGTILNGVAAALAAGALCFGVNASRLPQPVPDAAVLDMADSFPAQLAVHIARHYRVAQPGVDAAVDAAFLAAQQLGIDPLLVLAVIGVESSFNPDAQSEVGAQGLMQIMPRYHGTRLAEHGGEERVLDPLTNVAVGTRILSEYIERAGNLEAGLQFYNGAAGDPEGRYAQRVIAERERLQRAPRATAAGG